LQLHHCLHINSNNDNENKKKEEVFHRTQTSSATTASKSSLPSTVRSALSNSRMCVMNALITFTNHPRQDRMFQCLGIAI
jgi:hypothetical protein